MNEAWIIDACRTPRGIGKFGKGALSGLHPQRLGATALKAIAERNSLDTSDVDDIIWGTSSQRGEQGSDLGRMAALDAGYDARSSAVTLDRFCGSGITSVCIAAASIMSGMEDLLVAGGTEMMSSYGQGSHEQPPFLDSENLHLRALHPQPHQGVCADAVATLEGITREDVDRLAAESQSRAASAISQGAFDRSLVPFTRESSVLPKSVKDVIPPATVSFASLFDDRSSSRPRRKSSRTSFPKVRLLEVRSSSVTSKTTLAVAAIKRSDIRAVFIGVLPSLV